MSVSISLKFNESLVLKPLNCLIEYGNEGDQVEWV